MQQLRQLLHRDHLAFGLPVWSGRGAEHTASVGNVTHHARLCANHGLVADLQMVRNPGLRGYHDVIPQVGAAGNTDLPHDQTVPAHDHVVSHMDEVVNLRAHSDDSGAERATVNGGIGANLDIVAEGGMGRIRAKLGEKGRIIGGFGRN